MADDQCLDINGKPLKDLRVVDLKKELDLRGLSKTGSKSQLVERLRAQLLLENMKKKPVQEEETVPNLKLQDSADNDFVKQYLAQQQKRYEVEKEARKKLEEEMIETAAQESKSETESPSKEIKPDEESGDAIKSNDVHQETDNKDESQSLKTEEKKEEIVKLPETSMGDNKQDDTKEEESKPEQMDVQQGHEEEKKPGKEQSDVQQGKEEDNKNEGGDKPTDEKEEIKVTGKEEERKSRSRSSSSSSNSSRSRSRSASSSKSRSRSRSSKSRSRSRSSSSSSSGSSDEGPPKMKGTVQRAKSVSPAPQKDKAEEMKKEEDERKEEKMEEDVAEDKQKEEKMEEKQEEQQMEEGEVEISKEGEKTNDEKIETEKPKQESVPQKPPSRKISLKSRKSKDVDEGKEDDQGDKSKKRRWGKTNTQTSSKKPSVAISTDMLKEMIPDIKETKPLLDLKDDKSEEEASNDEDKRDIEIKITRKVVRDEEDDFVQVHNDEEQLDYDDDKMEEEEGNKIKQEVTMEPVEVKKTESVTTSRRISRTQSNVLPADEPELVRRKTPSPARNPVNKVIHIRNLVRPFTVGQLKAVLGKHGTLTETDFWIDAIKSKCYATFETSEEAGAARLALHGTRWPSSNPKILTVDFASSDEIAFHRDGVFPKVAKKTERQSSHQSSKKDDHSKKDIKLDDKKIEREREERRKKRHEDAKDKENKKREENRKTHVREWDRNKLRQSASPKPQTRSRSHDKRRRSKERSRKDVVEEAPAKLLDDLFKKTKTMPCIYWLPLTEEQIKENEESKKKKDEERTQRRKKMEEERVKEEAEEEERNKKRREERRREEDKYNTERKMREQEREERRRKDRDSRKRSRSGSRSKRSRSRDRKK